MCCTCLHQAVLNKEKKFYHKDVFWSVHFSCFIPSEVLKFTVEAEQHRACISFLEQTNLHFFLQDKVINRLTKKQTLWHVREAWIQTFVYFPGRKTANFSVPLSVFRNKHKKTSTIKCKFTISQVKFLMANTFIGATSWSRISTSHGAVGGGPQQAEGAVPPTQRYDSKNWGDFWTFLNACGGLASGFANVGKSANVIFFVEPSQICEHSQTLQEIGPKTAIRSPCSRGAKKEARQRRGRATIWDLVNFIWCQLWQQS